jgi:hypothetical protein
MDENFLHIVVLFYKKKTGKREAKFGYLASSWISSEEGS